MQDLSDAFKIGRARPASIVHWGSTRVANHSVSDVGCGHEKFDNLRKATTTSEMKDGFPKAVAAFQVLTGCV